MTGQPVAVAIALDDACNSVQFKLLTDLLVQHGVSLTLTRWIAGALLETTVSGYATWKLELFGGNWRDKNYCLRGNHP